MTPEQFVAWAEAVFGKYLPLMKAEVLRWMEPHTPWFIAGMRMTALEGHPSVYGKPPGVYELEQFKVKAYEKGHTLEAIAAANKSTPLIASEVAEEFVTPEEGLRQIEAAREKLNEKIRTMRKEMRLPDEIQRGEPYRCMSCKADVQQAEVVG